MWLKKYHLMKKNFNEFMSQLKETNATLDFYTDFNKIRRNVQNIEISLNMLNFWARMICTRL